MSGKSALFSAASTTAVQYSTAVDLANRGEGPGPGWLLGLKHSTFNKLLYPKVRDVFGGDVGYTVSGASPLSSGTTTSSTAREFLFLRATG